jgi:DNA-binding transcriptional ArsR family regulator
MELPDWFDPQQDMMLTPSRLRGLVHPIRIRLLNLLQDEGTATATQLARLVGQSSGVTSYHLRVLAEHGFIVEDTERGNARDRWWRALHRSTSFTFRMPGDPADAENVELAEQLVRILATSAYERMLAYIDSMAAHREDLPTQPWRFSDIPLRLTNEEARALTDEIQALVQRYRRQPGDPEPRPGTRRAILQYQLLPDDGPDDEPDGGPDEGRPDEGRPDEGRPVEGPDEGPEAGS